MARFCTASGLSDCAFVNAQCHSGGHYSSTGLITVMENKISVAQTSSFGLFFKVQPYNGLFDNTINIPGPGEGRINVYTKHLVKVILLMV